LIGWQAGELGAVAACEQRVETLEQCAVRVSLGRQAEDGGEFSGVVLEAPLRRRQRQSG
jgi:hypothetical protein